MTDTNRASSSVSRRTRTRSLRSAVGLASTVVVLAPIVVSACAQGIALGSGVDDAGGDARSADRPRFEISTPSFRTRADSIAWARTKTRADLDDSYRVIVSLQHRHVFVVDGSDTLLAAPVAIGTGSTLEYGGKKWTFDTPRGVRKVLRKGTDPVWTPPEWAYVEVAREHGLKLGHLNRKRPVILDDGTKLVVRGDLVGLEREGEEFLPMSLDEHIVFGDTLYIPPIGTKNRQIPGELGYHALYLGDGYMLHGTPYRNSIGRAASHGCVRMRDEDIAWMYENVPVGTKVYIF